MVVPGTIVEFNRVKHFKHIRSLGAGGTGDTHLFEDETTDMLFAFKKYSPKDTNYIDQYYQRFVDEIKILFKISHPNIVRVYNYYLYPEIKIGYLQMEHINGVTIDEYEQTLPWEKNWADIFIEIIHAFEYLETNNILHRDIRPANIMIDSNQNVKVIDFGFGKKLEPNEENGESVFLNWPVSQWPEEVVIEGIYNHKSEIYFVGKLIEKILLKKGITEFKYNHIIDKMIKVNPTERYTSFNEVSQDISKGVLGEIDFNSSDKQVYAKFANALESHIDNFVSKYEPLNDPNVTLTRLAALIRSSSLETHIQDITQLAFCFVQGKLSIINRKDIESKTVIDFYKLLQRISSFKQKIVLDNIYTRLSQIPIESDFFDDELPF